jgi:hypothetical protein
VLPYLPPLDAVIILIALGDLLLFVLRLARSLPPLCGCLAPVEDRLLWERRLGRHKVHALQLQKQRVGESVIFRGP